MSDQREELAQIIDQLYDEETYEPRYSAEGVCIDSAPARAVLAAGWVKLTPGEMSVVLDLLQKSVYAFPVGPYAPSREEWAQVLADRRSALSVVAAALAATPENGEEKP